MHPLQIIGLAAEIIAVAIVGILLDRLFGTVALAMWLCVCLGFLGWLHWGEIRPLISRRPAPQEIAPPPAPAPPTPDAKTTQAKSSSEPSMSNQDQERIKNLKGRLADLGKNLFNSWNALDASEKSQREKDDAVPMTFQQRIQRSAQVNAFFEDAAGKIWQTDGLSIVAILEEVDTEGEKATGISQKETQSAKFFCTPSQTFFVMNMKECAVHLEAIANRMR
jgi:hypothetical protein